MKLVEHDAVEAPKGTRYLVRRQRLLPVRDKKGKTRYYLRNLPLILPHFLNWLGRRLAR